MISEQFIECNYDIVVIGGGMSGICAALAAARHGAHTALIQSRPVLGGNASSEIRMHIAGASCHFGKKNLWETGILMELMLENKSRNTYFSYPIWDMVLWEKVRYQENLDLFLNTTLDSVETKDARITAAICRQSTTEKAFRFYAQIFVDATGNGTLGYFAGAEWRMGSEGREEFNEPDAPAQPNNNTMGNSIMFIASDKGEEVKFKKPSWAHTFTEEDLKLRPHGTYTWYHGEDGITEEYVPESGYWWIELGGDTGNIIENAEKVTEELYKVVYGIWDHLKNAGDHGAANYELDWVGIVPGIRESRRLVGDYLVTETDVLENRIFEDAVAYGGWPMDEHAPHGVYDKDVNPTRFINFPGAYTLPYRSYYSKNISNLMMAGRDISVTKMALGSSRVMGTCAVGGQAVGTAAAMAVHYGCSPREIGSRIHELQQTLLKDDCYIPGFRNEDPDDFALSANITATSHTPGNEPGKIVSGVARVVNEESNCWESETLEKGPQTIMLAFSPRELNQIRITFDPNLSREIMMSMTRTVQEREVKYMPLELVRDFTVKVFRNGEVIYQQQVKENNQRLCVYNLDAPLTADKVAVEVQATYGCPSARIFEIRLY